MDFNAKNKITIISLFISNENNDSYYINNINIFLINLSLFIVILNIKNNIKKLKLNIIVFNKLLFFEGNNKFYGNIS